MIVNYCYASFNAFETCCLDKTALFVDHIMNKKMRGGGGKIPKHRAYKVMFLNYKYLGLRGNLIKFSQHATTVLQL